MIRMFTILLLTMHLNCAHSQFDSPVNNGAGIPKSDGTFIQSYLVKDWTDKQWQQEFAALKEAKMQYIILGSTLNTDEDGKMYSIFPSSIPGVINRYKNDIVDNCLRNATAAGLKVFLGLNFDEKWWSANFTYEWISSQMELGNQVAKELIEKYKHKYKEAMYGWYWVWEVDNIHTPTPQLQSLLASAININLDYLNKATPEMPFMLCPFFNHKLGTSQESAAMWANVFRETHFRKGDIFAPQDCIGAGGLNLPILAEWFAALKTAVDSKPGLLFWVDTETFDQRFWTSATLDRFVKQMQIVAPYVSNYVTFAYSHYYSPMEVNPQFHKDYVYYLQHGALPATQVYSNIEKIGVTTIDNHTKEVNWTVKPGSEMNVAGYHIYLNDSLYADWQYRPGVNKTKKISIATSALKDRNGVFIEPYAASGVKGTGKKITIN